VPALLCHTKWRESRKEVMKAKIYKVFRNSEQIGDYTAVDAAEMLKCTPGTVRSYASRGLKLYGEYTFDVMPESYKPEKYWSMTPDMEMDWERTRQKFLRSGVDLSKINIIPVRE
jgi:hypothetical protein